MSSAVIANIKPAIVELKKGEKYFFCACGLSANQPFCDGSHKGSDITPIAFVAEADGKRGLCQCKQSNTLPFCDASHKSLSEDQIGTEFDSDYIP